MIKQCQRCGADYEPTGTRQKFCPACKRIAHSERVCANAKRRRLEHPDEVREKDRIWRETHKESVRAAGRRWRENNPEKFKQCRDAYNAKRRKRYKIERQKAKLRAKLQAVAAKRQAELEYHNKLYNPPSMFDGIGVHIPSQLANLGMP